MKKTGKIIRHAPSGNVVVKSETYFSLEQLLNIEWISDWKTDLEKIGKMDYEFQVAYEDYRTDYPFALLIVSKNHCTVIGWSDDNEIIKELPIFKR